MTEQEERAIHEAIDRLREEQSEQYRRLVRALEEAGLIAVGAVVIE